MTVGCTWDILSQRDFHDLFSEVSWVIPTLVVIESHILYEFPRFLDAFVTKLTTSRIFDSVPYGGIDIIIKDLDLESKIDAMKRDFFKSSNQSPWNAHPFYTKRMVSDRRGTTLFPSGSSMGFR
ncbi:hypothetical protein Tco_0927075 [Tanacetum coccineum]|uniref:Uncharacterized protein n=1 Tax=Tanacetum coccineum TaxID=301880 RepID=A0ABQ5DBN1_9ASTR